MKTLRLLILALAATLAGGAAHAQVTITAATDSAVILMGSQFTMRVELTAPEGEADGVSLVNAPRITNTDENFGQYGPVYVTAVSSDTITSNGRRTVGGTYTLQGFEPGLYTLPLIGAATGSGDTVWAGVQTLKILPMDVDTIAMELRPLAGVASPQSRWYDYIPLWTLWTLLVLVVAAVVFFLVNHFHRRKTVAAIMAQKPVPPYELAVSRLEQLRQSGATAPGHEKQFYTDLTDILRQYLHGRYGINAMEMTSSQIVRALRSNPDTRLPADSMDAVLRVADFVKFAKEKPLADDNVRSLQLARDFVEITKPVPPPPAPDPKEAAKAARATKSNK